MKKINLRKVILINRNFQLSLLFKISLMGVLIEGIFYSANFYFFKKMEDQAIQAGLNPDYIFFQYLDTQKVLMNKVFLISTILTIVVIVWGGLYLSHKVAGPLYRLTQHMKNFNINNIEPVKFRKGDYFPEIEETFNEFIKRKDS